MLCDKFSFFVHFRKSIAQDLALAYKPLRLLPEPILERICTRMARKSYTWSQIYNSSGTTLGSLELVPMSAKMMLTGSREVFLAQMNGYLDQLVAKGVKIAGLGALTAPMTAGGLALANRQDIGLTNGNAFTAVIMAQAVQKIISDTGLYQPTIAIIGATGSVGSCVSQLVWRDNNCNLLLMSQTLPKLQRLANTLSTKLNGNITLNTNMEAAQKADIVVVLTASEKTIVEAKHLKTNAIILDGTQPRNTAANLLNQRPDITLIDGGLVAIKDISISGGGLGLPKGIYFACFSETLLLAMAGYKGHFCLGNASLEHAQYISQLAIKYAHYGFELAPFSAFGQNVTLKTCVPNIVAA
jgi:fatty aldehyde-generating acyl-ACP reductase